VTLNTQSLTSLAEVRVFLEGSTTVSSPATRRGRPLGLEATLCPFHYNDLKRAAELLNRERDKRFQRIRNKAA